MDKSLRIANFGTFDVANYGDLLFPKIVQHYLGLDATEIVNVSPMGGQPYSDSSLSVGWREFVGSNQEFDAVVVGGGNTIHGRPTELSEYAAVRRTAYPSIWIGAAQTASRLRVPLIFNAPGVPREPGPILASMLRRVIERSDYCAVRDEFSADILAGLGCRGLSVIPDTAATLHDVLGDLAGVRAKGDLFINVNYVVIHLNERYVGMLDSEIAAILDNLALQADMPILLVPIGLCHGDLQYAERIRQLMLSPVEVFEGNSEIRTIAGAIANSSLYIGSSLHACITAMAYGVPALMVADNMYQHKFLGLLSQFGAQDALYSSWSSVEESGVVGRGRLKAVNMEGANESLDAHWNLVRKVIGSESVAGANKAGSVGRRFMDTAVSPASASVANVIDNRIGRFLSKDS